MWLLVGSISTAASLHQCLPVASDISPDTLTVDLCNGHTADCPAKGLSGAGD